MCQTQKPTILLEYEYKSTEKRKNGNLYIRRRKKQITTTAGLINYCNRNNLSFLDILVNKLKFNIYVHGKKIDSYNCRLCDKELGRARNEWANIEQKTISLTLCSCNVEINTVITKERYLTTFEESEIDEIYNDYKKTKMRNWTTKGLDVGSLNAFIKRYGVEEGTNLYNQKILKTTTTTITYYMNKGLSKEKAKIALTKRQATFSLKKCIETLGEVAGKQRWQTRQDKWQNTLTSRAQYKIDASNKKKVRSGGYSKISQTLFKSLNMNTARFATNSGEYRQQLLNGKHVSFDFKYDNKIIEFNGDLWHANPRKYESSDIINIGHRIKNNVCDIWERDNERIKEIIKLGYEVLIIWEYDYIKNPQRIKHECLEFLNEKYNS